MNIDELRASPRATVSIKEAAELLGVDPRTVSAAIHAGDIPAVRCGRRVLLPRHRLLAFIDGVEVTPSKSPEVMPTRPVEIITPERESAAELRDALLRVLLAPRRNDVG